MDVPDKWKFTDKEQIITFIENNAFATLVSASLEASRLPLYYDAEKNQLLGHFARNNRHWQEVANNRCLAIFDGAHHYISPSWYQSVPAVPTWNYASIHIQGTIHLLEVDATQQALNLLLQKYEPRLLCDRTIVSQDYQEKLAKGIVGFAMDVEHIDAKAKLGQHRSIADQQGVVAGLSQNNTPASQALLGLMKQLNLGLGS
ncbi:FMN-binding negative transcriptional regulator [Thalassotalea sp. G2M2-11]|uniref:FMN-binding negative transcriptional regulator n=1 Tax=Thalassotalea sp. G2M2-11 TaxID=2787627 RepID=UPI0019D0D405|nr:FMN-binding negative transcriptional regulator [Thalassotalea sp. G2M2-11]